jgi:hypothetical protein
MSLEDIDAECSEGEFTGKTDWQEVNKELKGQEAADAVTGVGSSTDFFQMDEEGNEINNVNENIDE